MKKIKYSIYALLALSLWACGNGEEKESETDIMADLGDLTEEIVAPENRSDWSLNTNDRYYTLAVPDRMFPMNELNNDASLQCGDVRQVIEGQDTIVLENYLIVMVETKEEMADYDLDYEFDVESYSEMSIASLGQNMSEFEVLTEEPKVEMINGLQCIKSDMHGAFVNGATRVGVHYCLGVFEGENAFYQVLTWCIDDQKPRFIDEMNDIIYSFKEK